MTTPMTDKKVIIAFFEAVKNGDLSTLQQITEFDFDIENDDGLKPMHLAARYGQIEVMQWLKDKGVQIDTLSNKVSVYGTPMHVAAKFGQVDAMQWLKDNGANLKLNDRGVEGYCFGSYATLNGQVKAVKWLGANGIEIDRCNWSFPEGVEGDGQEIIREFLKTNHFNPNSEFSVSFVVNKAAQHGRIDIMEWFKDIGIDFSFFNKGGQIPLHTAAEFGQIEAMQWFKNNGLDVNCRDMNGKKAVEHAIEHNQAEVLEWLLRNGVSANKPIHDNIAHGDHTPLKYALNFRSFKLIEVLVANGADVKMKLKEGVTVMHIAARLNQEEAMKLFKSKGAEIDIQDKDESTPMHKAAYGGALDAMKWLEENGANIEARDKDNQTPMLIAACMGRLDAVRWLKDKGADINVRDEDGETVMHKAAKGGLNHHYDIGGRIKVMKWLKDNGMDVNIKDYKDKTPMDYILEPSHLETARWLKNNGGYFDVQHFDFRGYVREFTNSYQRNHDEFFFWLFSGYSGHFIPFKSRLKDYLDHRIDDLIDKEMDYPEDLIVGIFHILRIYSEGPNPDKDLSNTIIKYLQNKIKPISGMVKQEFNCNNIMVKIFPIPKNQESKIKTFQISESQEMKIFQVPKGQRMQIEIFQKPQNEEIKDQTPESKKRKVTQTSEIKTFKIPKGQEMKILQIPMSKDTNTGAPRAKIKIFQIPEGKKMKDLLVYQAWLRKLSPLTEYKLDDGNKYKKKFDKITQSIKNQTKILKEFTSDIIFENISKKLILDSISEITPENFSMKPAVNVIKTEELFKKITSFLEEEYLWKFYRLSKASEYEPMIQEEPIVKTYSLRSDKTGEAHDMHDDC